MMAKARDAPTYKTLTRIIQMVKAVFMEKKQEKKAKGKKKDDDEDEEMDGEEKPEDGGVNKALRNFSKAISQEEYRKLLKFFAQELPALALRFTGVGSYPSEEKLMALAKSGKGKLGSGFDVTKPYKGISQQNQILLKSFSACYTKLLHDALSDDKLGSSQFLTEFFGNGPEVAKCCIPFSIYKKKLANGAAKVCALYSKLDQSSILLAFNTLRSLLLWAQDISLFENSLKRMYNEFTRESKTGGGGLHV